MKTFEENWKSEVQFGNQKHHHDYELSFNPKLLQMDDSESWPYAPGIFLFLKNSVLCCQWEKSTRIISYGFENVAGVTPKRASALLYGDTYSWYESGAFYREFRPWFSMRNTRPRFLVWDIPRPTRLLLSQNFQFSSSILTSDSNYFQTCASNFFPHDVTLVCCGYWKSSELLGDSFRKSTKSVMSGHSPVRIFKPLPFWIFGSMARRIHQVPFISRI